MFIWLTVLALTCIILTWILRQLRVDNYSNKYVFITGCDTGFGNLLTKKLDDLGFNVIAGCLTEKGETELAKSCSKKLMTLHFDVTNEVDISKAKEYTERHLPAGTGTYIYIYIYLGILSLASDRCHSLNTHFSILCACDILVH